MLCLIPIPARLCQWLALGLLALWPVVAEADDRQFRLATPEVLRESGLLGYILPRFSLKTGVRIEIVPEEAEAEAGLGSGRGRAVFAGKGATWRLRLIGNHPGAARFAEWLGSEVGQRAITGYQVAGVTPFSLPEAEAAPETGPVFDGDPAEGLRAAQAHCGRCHVVAPGGRGGIGSTPSFAVLRTLADWEARFQSFYALKPHPAFTQITGVTAPFALHLPPAITPVVVTPEQIEAILAYVAGLTPADLGAPIQVQ